MFDDGGERSEKVHSPSAKGTLVLLTSMSSAGSGWLFNLTNDLLKLAGKADVRWIRDEYGLGDVLRWDNCNIDHLDQATWDRLVPAIDDGHTFVVKSHGRPTPLVRQLSAEGRLKATYIYRDPRDVIVSAYQRGCELRAKGYRGSFTRIRTIDIAMLWMRYRQIPVFAAWSHHPDTLLLRYEDLVQDDLLVLRLLSSYLEVVPSDDDLGRLVQDYRGDNAREKVGTHYRGGGRRRNEMTPGQRWRCNLLCGSSIRAMGYEG